VSNATKVCGGQDVGFDGTGGISSRKAQLDSTGGGFKSNIPGEQLVLNVDFRGVSRIPVGFSADTRSHYGHNYAHERD
jgi:hypothetical protein